MIIYPIARWYLWVSISLFPEAVAVNSQSNETHEQRKCELDTADSTNQSSDRHDTGCHGNQTNQDNVTPNQEDISPYFPQEPPNFIPGACNTSTSDEIKEIDAKSNEPDNAYDFELVSKLNINGNNNSESIKEDKDSAEGTLDLYTDPAVEKVNIRVKADDIDISKESVKLSEDKLNENPDTIIGTIRHTASDSTDVVEAKPVEPKPTLRSVASEPKCVKFEESSDFDFNKVVDDKYLLFRSDSLFVNIDSTSTYSISGETSPELCTQYSAAESDNLVEDISEDLSDTSEVDELDSESEDDFDEDVKVKTEGNCCKKSGIKESKSNDSHEKVLFELFDSDEDNNTKSVKKTNALTEECISGIEDNIIEIKEDSKSDESASDDDVFRDCEHLNDISNEIEDLDKAQVVKPETEHLAVNNQETESSVEISINQEEPLFSLTGFVPGFKSPSVDISDHSSIIRRLKFRERRLDSDLSGYESYYSLDNSCLTASSHVTPAARVKKTLTWTPRIFENKRFGFGNSLSTSTFSDAASFYTAETSGTFYSARSFQLDSVDNFQTCNNFQTCENFQEIDTFESCNNFPTEYKAELAENPQEFSLEDTEHKSKLSKAKDAFVRGKDFVKTKFETYYKRLPLIGKSEKVAHSSRVFCYHPCGFSCSRVLKDASLYSLDANVCHNNNDFQLKTVDNSASVNPESAEQELEADKQDEINLQVYLEQDFENVKIETGTELNNEESEVGGNLVRVSSDRRTCPGVMLKRKLGGQDSVRLTTRDLMDLTNDCDIDSEDSDDEGLTFHRDTSEYDVKLHICDKTVCWKRENIAKSQKRFISYVWKGQIFWVSYLI